MVNAVKQSVSLRIHLSRQGLKPESQGLAVLLWPYLRPGITLLQGGYPAGAGTGLSWKLGEGLEFC